MLYRYYMGLLRHVVAALLSTAAIMNSRIIANMDSGNECINSIIHIWYNILLSCMIHWVQSVFKWRLVRYFDLSDFNMNLILCCNFYGTILLAHLIYIIKYMSVGCWAVFVANFPALHAMVIIEISVIGIITCVFMPFFA